MPPATAVVPLPTRRNDNTRLRTEELFRHGRELVIEHRGEEYRLRLTRNDKLILNK